MDINKIKNNALQNHYCHLNEEQQRAVFSINGPLLILAGAGSGKTTVLVNRIANMISFGDAYNCDFSDRKFSNEDIDFLTNYKRGDDSNRLVKLLETNPVNAWNILAITFTNKAAGELKERLLNQLGDCALDINAGTFHSSCSKILRREIENIGYAKNFHIYDTDDSIRVIKECLAELNIPEKNFPPKMFLTEISRAKDSLLSPEQYQQTVQNDFRKEQISKVYTKYQNKLRLSNALDFDDMIVKTIELFEKSPEVLKHYQNRYKYILVDEYQDTNHAQYTLISMLSKVHQNLCVVGDDDQSIYKFRGATIRNILEFEEQFKDAKVIKLEQNYRSTQTILNCANAVISNNENRKSKKLWTSNGDGEKVLIKKLLNEQNEANFIADTILKNVVDGKKHSDHAVLYRMNSQSNTIEKALVHASIPYRIFGGTKFYDRKEIKDVIAYLSVINNPNDAIRLKRILNVPKRGIGNSTVSVIDNISATLNIPFFEVILNTKTYIDLSKKAVALNQFTSLISELREQSEQMDIVFLLDTVLEKSGYLDSLIAEGVEGKVRIDNVNELKSNIVKYCEETEQPSLAGFLEEVSLYTDLENMDSSEDYVTLMTLHSSKGLEYPVVFIPGMEENIFPSRLSASDLAEIEEERRLAYVGITRAKKQLIMTNVAERMIFGNTERNRQSRFANEIPNQFVEYSDNSITKYNHSSNTNMFATKTQQFDVGTVGAKPKAEASTINYTVGDRVSHKVFGVGMVLNMLPAANDCLVEVAFENVGTKKIMANFAKLQKI